jgi:hypothetical protein
MQFSDFINNTDPTLLEELRDFAKQMTVRGSGAQWREVGRLMEESILPARDQYLDALKQARSAFVDMQRRHADAVRMRDELREQLAALNVAIAEQYPAERAAATAAPEAIVAKADECVDPAVVDQIAAAVKLYASAFRP